APLATVPSGFSGVTRTPAHPIRVATKAIPRVKSVSAPPHRKRRVLPIFCTHVATGLIRDLANQLSCCSSCEVTSLKDEADTRISLSLRWHGSSTRSFPIWGFTLKAAITTDHP